MFKLCTEILISNLLPPVEKTDHFLSLSFQYRPVKEGIPLTAGYGIAKKPVGFLKVDLVLQLSPDWSGRLLANPYLYGASESTYSVRADERYCLALLYLASSFTHAHDCIQNDEDYFYSAVHVAGFTMIDIIRLLSNNILVNKVTISFHSQFGFLPPKLCVVDI